jgi:hypothetical protein
LMKERRSILFLLQNGSAVADVRSIRRESCAGPAFRKKQRTPGAGWRGF